jgi:hypothetical protein
MEVTDFYAPLFGIVYLVCCDFAMDPTANVRQSREKCDGDRGSD